MWPDKRRDELPMMPKGRYAIMARHMPRVGNLGLDMMLRTCTIQVNLDYESEADMVRKFRVGLALQPVATALFANSPLTEGKPNGYKSFRSHIWEDTDPQRTGMLPFVFEDGFGYERYCDYALDVPMYFVFRDGKYSTSPAKLPRFSPLAQAAAAPTARSAGRLSASSTICRPPSRGSPEELLEMRAPTAAAGTDLRAPALWVGLLYADEALDAAWDRVKHWTIEEREQLRADVRGWR